LICFSCQPSFSCTFFHIWTEPSEYFYATKDISCSNKVSIGNAKIAGMADDLMLDSAKYSVVLVVFFAGYVACEVPSK